MSTNAEIVYQNVKEIDTNDNMKSKICVNIVLVKIMGVDNCAFSMGFNRPVVYLLLMMFDSEKRMYFKRLSFYEKMFEDWKIHRMNKMMEYIESDCLKHYGNYICIGPTNDYLNIVNTFDNDLFDQLTNFKYCQYVLDMYNDDSNYPGHCCYPILK